MMNHNINNNNINPDNNLGNNLGNGLTKRMKPNLVDPKIKNRISKVLNPPKEDYWQPTKNVAQSFYNNYIKPNIWLIMIIILLGLILLYRYREIQYRKMNEQLQKDKQLHKQVINTAINHYDQQKELMREPRISHKRNNQIENFASVTKPHSHIPSTKPMYPVYPYGGGKLVSPSRK
jgi:hypothetical protein